MNKSLPVILNGFSNRIVKLGDERGVRGYYIFESL